MISGPTENSRFSSKCLSWSFSLLFQHLFYIFVWREVISYIQFFFLLEGSTKNAVKIAQLTYKFLFQLFFCLNSMWQLFFAISLLCFSCDTRIGETVVYFQNPLEFFFLKWEFEEVKLFISVDPSSSLFQCPLHPHLYVHWKTVIGFNRLVCHWNHLGMFLSVYLDFVLLVCHRSSY